MLYKKQDLNNELFNNSKDSPKLAFSAIVGSYNYGLENKGSDLDIKCFMYPSKQALFQNHSLNLTLNNYESENLKSHTVLISSTPKKFRDSSIKKEFEFKDFRELYSLLSGGSINSLEILCSNVDYVEDTSLLFKAISAYKEDILLCNLLKLPKCIHGLVTKISNKNLDDISGKKLAECLRYVFLFNNMISGELCFNEFYNSIKVKDLSQRELILSLKENNASPQNLLLAKTEISDFLDSTLYSNRINLWSEIYKDKYVAEFNKLKYVDKSGFETYPFLSDILQNNFNEYFSL